MSAWRSASEYLPTSFWLMKTEPAVFSFDDLVARQREPWDGVRNYQARNFMRDHMAPGHRVLFYHSGIEAPGIVGLATILERAIPDDSALDRTSPYHDPRLRPGAPSPWVKVLVGHPSPLPRPVPLAVLRSDPVTAAMLVTRPGQRLSVQPVSATEFARVIELAGLGLAGAKKI